MKKFSIFGILILIYQCSGEGKINNPFAKISERESKFLKNISRCIEDISHLELEFRPTVVIDTHNVNNKTKGDMFSAKVANKLMRNGMPSLIIGNEITINLQDITVKALIVTYFDICDDILNFNFSSIDKKMKYLIVIFDPSSKTCIDKLQEIKNYVDKYDVTFMPLDIDEDINKMYSFIPKIDEYTCKQIVEKYYHINTCAHGLLENKEIFPVKDPLNLNKCPFKVGMAALHPFAKIRNKKKLKTYDRINITVGSDVEIINILANLFNATLQFHYIYRKEENPYVNTDFLNFVINGSLDVCAGGLYRMYGNAVEYSGLYGRQAILWTYAVQREERSWENLLHDMHGLYMFFIFYFTYSISWYLIRIFDEDPVTFKNTLLYGWGALVGGTLLTQERSLKQKILNLGLFIMKIYLYTYISIHLYSFLTMEEPPEMFVSDDELMNSGRVVYLETSTRNLINEQKYLDFANSSLECVSFIDCIEKILQKHGMTIVLQGHFYQFQSDTAVNGEARMMKLPEHVLTIYNEMIVRKDSVLLEGVKFIIQNLFEAGITQALYAKATGVLVIGKASHANTIMLMHNYSCQAGCTITFKQFAVIFYAFAVGCIIACIVFIFEIKERRRQVNVVNVA